MRQRTGIGLQRSRRAGVTLLELVVVLVLLGLILSLVTPALIRPSAPSRPELGAVIALARRAAILRGEPVTIAFGDDRTWRIDADASPAAPPIAQGKLAAAIGRVEVHVSPLGTCVPESPASPSTREAHWNAAGCGLDAASHSGTVP